MGPNKAVRFYTQIEYVGLRHGGPTSGSNMDTLSRREEEALLKSTKARALKECDQFVKGLYFRLLLQDNNSL